MHIKQRVFLNSDLINITLKYVIMKNIVLNTYMQLKI